MAIEITYRDKIGVHVFVSEELTIESHEDDVLAEIIKRELPDMIQEKLIIDQHPDGAKNQAESLTEKMARFGIIEFSCKSLD